MLETLRRIVQEVNSAPNLESALEVLVSQVRDTMNAEVASIYLLDYSQKRYILMASKGLNPASIREVSLEISEGLVGLVGVREEPLNLENASAHPKFRYFASTGEERFQSFLGVPIIHQRKLLGVLVTQRIEQKRFDQSEEAFLITISAQLAGVIAAAEATGAITGMNLGSEDKYVSRFTGIGCAQGVALGTAWVHRPKAQLSNVPDKVTADIEGELVKMDNAVADVHDELAAIAAKIATSLSPQEHALFDVYAQMLQDQGLVGEIKLRIQAGNWAEGALRFVIERHIKQFEGMDHPYFRERALDVKDLGIRMLAKLQAKADNFIVTQPSILVGEEITASVLMDFPSEYLKGVISIRGTANSHMAIVARALGVPCVMGLSLLPIRTLGGCFAIVDGYRGEVIINPSVDLKRIYESIVLTDAELNVNLLSEQDEPCTTLNGVDISLLVNTGISTDVALAKDRCTAGVGLYRTEIPFMARERFPSEQEQVEFYRHQLAEFAPRPVTMRTLDIGGDKMLPYFPIIEDNPFLGWRGIRVTLDHPEIFMVQLRAMLKASVNLNNLRILLPMIGNVFEIEESLHLIHRAYLEVQEEGFNVQMPPIGVMIEIPAAIYQIGSFAQRVDFLSVGTNDLTQYLLAVDRNNSRVADLYHGYHPAVLQALKSIVKDAEKHRIEVSVCGEMAGDPALAVLLAAMGYRSLSLSIAHLLRVKWALRRVDLQQMEKLLEEIDSMDNAEVIRSYVEYSLCQSGLDQVIRFNPGVRISNEI
ncbi:MAG: phosphoenolpyruvate--protein phosphotransferase [Pseudomonadota bacterium]